MKYLIGLIFLGWSVSAMAINCPYGEVIFGKLGGEYCVYTKRGMNWWSAHQWCQAQGLHLASPEEACNYDEYSWAGGSCKNLHLNILKSVWTNLTTDKGEACVIDMNNSAVHLNASYTDGFSPICVE